MSCKAGVFLILGDAAQQVEVGHQFPDLRSIIGQKILLQEMWRLKRICALIWILANFYEWLDDTF